MASNASTTAITKRGQIGIRLEPEAVGVALAVGTLVHRADDRSTRLQRGYGREDALADLAVTLRHQPLLFRGPAGRACRESTSGIPDLADVVEPRILAREPDLCGREAEAERGARGGSFATSARCVTRLSVLRAEQLQERVLGVGFGLASAGALVRVEPLIRKVPIVSSTRVRLSG